MKALIKDILRCEVPVPKKQTPASWLVAAFSILVPAMSWADIYIWAEESGGNTTFFFSGSFEASTLDGQDDNFPNGSAFLEEAPL